MLPPGLTPSSIDWPLTTAIGVIAVVVSLVLLFRFKDRLLVFALGAALLEVGLFIATRGLIRPFLGQLGWWANFLLIAPALVAGVILLTWRGWWSTAGFTPPSQWRSLSLLWLLGLFLLIPYLGLTRGTHVSAGTALLITAYTVLATGTEELFYRGIVLRATIGYGVIPAVLISSALFGASHVNGFFASYVIDPLYIFGQTWLGFLLGIFFAAVRLRVNAIWPTMAAHALYDLPGVLVYGIYAFTYRPTARGLLISTIFGIFFAAIGLFALRKATPSIIPTELKI